MPRGDGTGPLGQGPGTGRGRGWCRGFLFPNDRFSSKRLGFLGALVPLVGAVIRDAINPNGLLRSVSRKLLINKKPAKNNSDAIEANYSIIDEKAPQEITKEKRQD